VDRAGWFAMDVAREKILKGQLGLLEELSQMVERDLASGNKQAG
jgi:predicted NUDIX family NTP pyrophosphohydrolase